MSPRNFSIDDLMKLWHVKIKPTQVYSNKLQVESNPVLIQTFTATRSVPIVTNVRRLQHTYIGVDIEKWWGWSMDELFGESVYEFLKFVHPKDLLVHEKANKLLAAAFDNGNEQEKLQIKLSFNYRIKTKDGKYIHILQNSSVLEVDTEGNFQTALTILQDLIFDEAFNKHYIHLYGVNKYSQIVEYCREDESFNTLERLSEREREVTQCLLGGLDSEQIGSRLCISKHTVNTHRRKILQKLRLSSSHEISKLATLVNLFV